MREHSALDSGSRRRKHQSTQTRLRRPQSQESSEVIWDAEQGDRGLWLARNGRVASQSLAIGKPIMGSLRPREDSRQGRSKRFLSRWKVYLDALMTQELHAGASMFPARPVSPEQRSRATLARMQQETHAAGVLGLVPVPLTLFAQGADTTVRDPSLIDQTQAAISLWSPFTTPQALASRAAQAPIGLEGKVRAGEAARFPGGRGGRWSIPRGECRGSR